MASVSFKLSSKALMQCSAIISGDRDLSGSFSKSSKGETSISVSAAASGASGDDEADALDSFMKSIEEGQLNATVVSSSVLTADGKAAALESDEDDALDNEDDRLESGAMYDSDGNIVDARVAAATNVQATSLPPVCHAAFEYSPAAFCFYAPAPAVAALTSADISQLRRELQLRVLVSDAGVARAAADACAPVQSFAQLGLEAACPALLAAVAGAGFAAPTPIQAQAMPLLLSGCDVLALAATGSGKTLAYALPLLRHCLGRAQARRAATPASLRAVPDHAGTPTALVLAPTRELAQQIHAQLRRLGRAAGLVAVLLTGGSSRWEQMQALEGGCDVIVATPGRAVDVVGSWRGNPARRSAGADSGSGGQAAAAEPSPHPLPLLAGVTFLVLDEADRMLDMGFAPQVRALLLALRPPGGGGGAGRQGQQGQGRQTAMFSATCARRVEELARAAMAYGCVKVTVGAAGAAAAGVAQSFAVLAREDAKWPWLQQHLCAMLAPAPAAAAPAAAAAVAAAKIIVFVNSRAGADALADSINTSFAVRAAWAAGAAAAGLLPPEAAAAASKAGPVALSLHGDKAQSERDAVIAAFRRRGGGGVVSIDAASLSSLSAPVLVATDVAARGLDIAGVSAVVSFDAPRNADTHVHRIGRTGRMAAAAAAAAGSAGVVGGQRSGVACTLLCSAVKRDVACARALARAMAAGGQPVPPALAALASSSSSQRGGGGSAWPSATLGQDSAGRAGAARGLGPARGGIGAAALHGGGGAANSGSSGGSSSGGAMSHFMGFRPATAPPPPLAPAPRVQAATGGGMSLPAASAAAVHAGAQPRPPLPLLLPAAAATDVLPLGDLDDFLAALEKQPALPAPAAPAAAAAAATVDTPACAVPVQAAPGPPIVGGSADDACGDAASSAGFKRSRSRWGQELPGPSPDEAPAASPAARDMRGAASRFGPAIEGHYEAALGAAAAAGGGDYSQPQVVGVSLVAVPPPAGIAVSAAAAIAAAFASAGGRRGAGGSSAGQEPDSGINPRLAAIAAVRAHAARLGLQQQQQPAAAAQAGPTAGRSLYVRGVRY